MFILSLFSLTGLPPPLPVHTDPSAYPDRATMKVVHVGESWVTGIRRYVYTILYP